MWDALDYLNYRYELLPDGRRFENAMLNFAGIAGLCAALEVVERFGRGGIEAEIRKSSDRLLNHLLSLGFTNHSSRKEREWSGILSVTHPQVSPEAIAARLKQRQIVTSIRDHRLRVSPHAYHTEEALRRVEEAFAEAVK